jgi:predicted nucleotidyltransferase
MKRANYRELFKMKDLVKLAEEKVQGYIKNEKTVAVAVTGSIARNMTWEGSDIDIYVFRDGPDDFEDGIIEGVYWEVDFKSSELLNMDITYNTWLKPLSLNKSSERLFESLWGCDIKYDPTGKLKYLKEQIESRMNDTTWLQDRINLYLSYGHGCIDALKYAEPLEAIVGARSVATDYGITSFWMAQGKLLTSVCRIPEKLSIHSRLQTLCKEIFSLTGENGAKEFLSKFRSLPEQIKQKIQSDLELEIIPVFNKGCFDGGVRHMRQGMARWFHPKEVKPILALEDNMESQKQRVLEQTKELLILCEKSKK